VVQLYGVDTTKEHRRKRLLFLVLLVVALAAVAYFGLLHRAGSGHRINLYTALKLCVGMTQSEVEALFGAPSGDYSSEPRADRPKAPEDRRPDLRRQDWTTEEGGAVVYFGPDGRVADFTLWVTPGGKMTERERIRKWWYWLTVW
jgi:hypothetical protein